MKKFMLLLMLIFIISTSHSHIETERTIWVPWTIEHSYEWEIIEQNDTTASFFRRNEYFETMNELITRDKNWLLLCKYIQNQYKEKIFFPDLGFAIIRKTDQQLIGSLRIKFSDQSGTVSFGYGLRPEARQGKFGQEITTAFFTYIDHILKTPIVTFTDNKNNFMSAWYTEGKKEEPNFEYLSSFFSHHTLPLQKIVGSVDIQNAASLAILMRNGMQPFALTCNKYICANDTHYFSCDFVLQYPANTEQPCHIAIQLANNILSRDNIRIQNTHNYCAELFHIDSCCNYILFSRAEKAILQPIEKISSFYDCSILKGIIARVYYPPYCFIK